MTIYQARRKLPRSQLRDLAADEIRRLIMSGEASAGEALPLESVADQIGVSITPIREALLVLAQEGWVDHEPHRSFRVASFRRTDVEDLYVVHAFVAGEIARRAATRITPAQLEELERLDAEIVATSATETRRLEELNVRVHDALNAAPDAPRLLWFTRAARFFPDGIGWSAVPGWIEHTRRGHRELLRALKAGDAEGAAAAAREHTQAGGDLLMRHLENTGLFAVDSPALGEPVSGSTEPPPSAHRRPR